MANNCPNEHGKFNRFSFHVIKSCKGKLLRHQSEALEFLQNKFSGAYPGIGDAPLPKRPRLEAESYCYAGVSMPTGSGKTGVICCLPYYLGSIGLQEPPLASFPVGEPRYRFDKQPVLILAPSVEIAKQLEGQLTVVAGGQHENFLLGKEIVHRSNKKKVLPDVVKIDDTVALTDPQFLDCHDVIIANVQKFPSKKTSEETKWWGEELPDDMFSMVIVDEAHHFPAPIWTRIIDKFKHHALMVFFTATPFRSDKKRVIIEREFWYHLSLEDARERRIIRETNWVPVETVYNNEESEAENIYPAVLEKIKELQENKNRDHPLPNDHPHMAIAIVPSKGVADRVAEKWEKDFGGENSAIAYHSGVRPRKQSTMMKRIRANEVKLLVVVGQLLEGFDHPPISIAAILTKIDSPVKFAQFIGRAQRIVRGPEGLESNTIMADIITHSRYQQDDNYDKFQQEILIDDESNELRLLMEAPM